MTEYETQHKKLACALITSTSAELSGISHAQGNRYTFIISHSMSPEEFRNWEKDYRFRKILVEPKQYDTNLNLLTDHLNAQKEYDGR